MLDSLEQDIVDNTQKKLMMPKKITKEMKWKVESIQETI